MSYARSLVGVSDVYVIAHVEYQDGRNLVCYCDDDARGLSAQEMIDHLLTHRERGDLVPEYALERLRSELPK